MLVDILAAALEHHQAGRLPQAELLYEQLLQVEPKHAEALHLLGVIAHQTGRQEAAVSYIERAIALNADAAVYQGNLGTAYHALGRNADAVACYRRALQLDPSFAEAYNNLGNALCDLGQHAEARACHEQALRLRPDSFRAYNNLGAVLLEQGQVAEARACLERCLTLQPAFAEAHNNLGNAWKEQGRLDAAHACYERALQLQPDLATAHNNLGTVLNDQGRLDEALDCFSRALQLQPAYADAHSNYLLSLHYRPGVSLAALAEAHAEYDRRQAAPLRATWQPHVNRPDPQRPLRLGFVSPDFGRHPVGYFTVQLLEELRRHECHTVCYSDRVLADDLTERIAAAAGTWRSTRGASDAQLAQQIRADGIDVLFDLAGHTARNRLRVFARKPAPLQITWAGYVGTTGLESMDYLLADRWEVPAGLEPGYREAVLRMAAGYVCYAPPPDAPAVGPLPLAGSGRATFGSFHNPVKIQPAVVEIWSAILRRTPGARLLLKYRGFDDPDVVCRYRELFAHCGVTPSQIDIQGYSPHVELLAAYHQVDLALDPFPYSGGLTTCEALWMGVPVVTCPGETFASRHALAHLSNVGLTATIAHDLTQYVELAVSLAQDATRLADLRRGLRAQMAASPLCDGRRFAADFLTLLRRVWQRWCAAISA